jgi:hypothetical protein
MVPSLYPAMPPVYEALLVTVIALKATFLTTPPAPMYPNNPAYPAPVMAYPWIVPPDLYPMLYPAPSYVPVKYAEGKIEEPIGVNGVLL